MSAEASVTKADDGNVAAQLLAIVEDMISDWDTDFEGKLDLHTRLIEDLAFESIDVVQLIVAIETHFGRRDMPFEEVLMEDGRYVEELTLGELARFLEAHV